jgi:hypothetical protein
VRPDISCCSDESNSSTANCFLTLVVLHQCGAPGLNAPEFGGWPGAGRIRSRAPRLYARIATAPATTQGTETTSPRLYTRLLIASRVKGDRPSRWHLSPPAASSPTLRQCNTIYSGLCTAPPQFVLNTVGYDAVRCLMEAATLGVTGRHQSE